MVAGALLEMSTAVQPAARQAPMNADRMLGVALLRRRAMLQR